MLSQKARYALRALFALTSRPLGQTVMIAEIAAENGGENVRLIELEEVEIFIVRLGPLAARRALAVAASGLG